MGASGEVDEVRRESTEVKDGPPGNVALESDPTEDVLTPVRESRAWADAIGGRGGRSYWRGGRANWSSGRQWGSCRLNAARHEGGARGGRGLGRLGGLIGGRGGLWDGGGRVRGVVAGGGGRHCRGGRGGGGGGWR